jgi:hypothetical protein
LRAATATALSFNLTNNRDFPVLEAASRCRD